MMLLKTGWKNSFMELNIGVKINEYILGLKIGVKNML